MFSLTTLSKPRKLWKKNTKHQRNNNNWREEFCEAKDLLRNVLYSGKNEDSTGSETTTGRVRTNGDRSEASTRCEDYQ